MFEKETAALYFKKLQADLATIYEEREALNIATIIFEDAFGIHFANLKLAFDIPKQVELSRITTQLLKHRPWQYVLQQADFYGLKFKMNNQVLIPRPETEELVQEIINNHKKEAIQILDIGTGSGCIAIALQKNLINAQLTAVDISTKALELAQQNAEQLEAKIVFQQVDILDKIACQKMGKYHVIVSNPPYILDAERSLMPKQVLDFEPHLALFVTNNDPLQFYSRIADFALEHLYQNGVLYFEINEYFGQEVLEMLLQKGFDKVELIQDISGKNRIALAKLQKKK